MQINVMVAGGIKTVGILYIAKEYPYKNAQHIRTFIFLPLAIADYFILFVLYKSGLIQPLILAKARRSWGYFPAWKIIEDIVNQRMYRHLPHPGGNAHQHVISIHKKPLNL